MTRKSSVMHGFADTLNFRLTVFLLSSIAGLTMVRVLISEPIRCYTPSQLTTKQSDHVEQMCWMANKYYIIDDEKGSRSNELVPMYHQWIPAIFALQALLFYIPKLLWKLGSSRSGSINIRHIESAAVRLNSSPENAAQTVRYMSRCLGQHLSEFQTRWKSASVPGRAWMLVNANHVTWLYLAVKFLCVVNIIGQFVLLDLFLADGDSSFGVSVLEKFRSAHEYDSWTTSKMLPLSFYCDFNIRSLATMTRYTFQCSLPMNLWYQIIFLMVWFWFVYVAIVTISSLVLFVLSQFNVFYQKSYCVLRLTAMGKTDKAKAVQVSRFVNDFLSRDVWFVVKQVGRISGDEAATQLMCGLWDCYISQGPGDSDPSPEPREMSVKM